jgi:hypothetical protein
MMIVSMSVAFMLVIIVAATNINGPWVAFLDLDSCVINLIFVSKNTSHLLQGFVGVG